MSTGVVELEQVDIGIIECTYDKPGMFMFHAHVTEFTDLGWMGMFNVVNSNHPKFHPVVATNSIEGKLNG